MTAFVVERESFHSSFDISAGDLNSRAARAVDLDRQVTRYRQTSIASSRGQARVVIEIGHRLSGPRFPSSRCGGGHRGHGWPEASMIGLALP